MHQKLVKVINITTSRNIFLPIPNPVIHPSTLSKSPNLQHPPKTLTITKVSGLKTIPITNLFKPISYTATHT